MPVKEGASQFIPTTDGAISHVVLPPVGRSDHSGASIFPSIGLPENFSNAPLSPGGLLASLPENFSEWAKLFEFTKGRIPLSNIPLGREIGGDAEVLNTAEHEARHAIVAMFLGANLQVLSVEPDGNSYGRTRVSASLPAFQIIAAAGATGRNASGFGGDFMQIAAIDRFLGRKLGSSIDGAVAAADNIINKAVPDNVLSRMASIIAYMKKVDGQSQMEEVIERAYLEEAFEKKDMSVLQQYFDFKSYREWLATNLETEGISATGENLIIEEFEWGSKFSYEGPEGKFVEIRCRFCGGLDGHTRECGKNRKVSNTFMMNPVSPTDAKNFISGDVLHPLKEDPKISGREFTRNDLNFGSLKVLVEDDQIQ